MDYNLGVMITMGIFIVTHIVTTVWWASRMNTLMDIVRKELADVVIELKANRGLYSSKSELAAVMAVAEKERVALWKNVDEIKRDIKLCQKEHKL